MAFRCHAAKVDPNVRKGETSVVAACLGLISLAVSFAQGVFRSTPISGIPGTT